MRKLRYLYVFCRFSSIHSKWVGRKNVPKDLVRETFQMTWSEKRSKGRKNHISDVPNDLAVKTTCKKPCVRLALFTRTKKVAGHLWNRRCFQAWPCIMFYFKTLYFYMGPMFVVKTLYVLLRPLWRPPIFVIKTLASRVLIPPPKEKQVALCCAPAAALASPEDVHLSSLVVPSHPHRSWHARRAQP